MGRWTEISTVSLMLALGIIALAGAFVSPILVIVAFGSCVLLLLWERSRLIRAMRTLVHRLQRPTFDTKLEVGVGAWGEVCHAVNRLLQQWRTEQHVQRLQPSQPALYQINPLDLHPPVEGHITPIAALSVGRLAIADPLDEVRARIHLIRAAIEHEQALLQWHDRAAILVLGALTNEPEPLRRALAAVIEIIAAARITGLPLPPMALSSGQGRVAVVPLLGLHTTGEPIEQARLLVQQTAPGMLTCTEETYLHLRSSGLLPLNAMSFTPMTHRYTLALADLYQHQNAE